MAQYPTNSPTGGGSGNAGGLSPLASEFPSIAKQPFKPTGPSRHTRPSPLMQEFPGLAKQPFVPLTERPKGKFPHPGPGGFPNIPRRQFLKPRFLKNPLLDAIGFLMHNPTLPLRSMRGPMSFDDSAYFLRQECKFNDGGVSRKVSDVLAPTDIADFFACGVWASLPGMGVGQFETYHLCQPGDYGPYGSASFVGKYAAINQYYTITGSPWPPQLTPGRRWIPNWGPTVDPIDPGASPPMSWPDPQPGNPLPFPLQPGRKDNPYRETGPKPGKDPAGQPGSKPGANPGGKPFPPHQGFPPGPPDPYKPSPPGKGKKERKFTVAGNKWNRALGEFFGKITEWSDLIDSLYDALPCEVRGGKMISTPHVLGGPPVSVCAFAPKRGMVDKMELLYRNWETVDIDQAVFNFMANQFEDEVIGRIGSALKDALKSNPFWVSPKGIGFGPAI